MAKKDKKADPALKERLEREAKEREDARAAAGNSKPHKTAAQMRESAERRKNKNLKSNLAKAASEVAALMNVARAAGAEASEAAAEASRAAAEASRAAAAARFASSKNASRKLISSMKYKERFHKNRPHHGENPLFGESKRLGGGRKTRKNKY